jgi:hypothetical protein
MYPVCVSNQRITLLALSCEYRKGITNMGMKTAIWGRWAYHLSRLQLPSSIVVNLGHQGHEIACS